MGMEKCNCDLCEGKLDDVNENQEVVESWSDVSSENS